MIDIDVEYQAYGLDFIWSKQKSARVRKEHNISFEDVVDVFLDQHAIEVPSGDIDGANLALVGACKTSGIIFVAYCYRNSDHFIRLVSARLADSAQKEQYHLHVLRNLGISK